jgi:hypothetical protein
MKKNIAQDFDSNSINSRALSENIIFCENSMFAENNPDVPLGAPG